jgi:hypothetical protein
MLMDVLILIINVNWIHLNSWIIRPWLHIILHQSLYASVVLVFKTEIKLCHRSRLVTFMHHQKKDMTENKSRVIIFWSKNTSFDIDWMSSWTPAVLLFWFYPDISWFFYCNLFRVDDLTYNSCLLESALAAVTSTAAVPRSSSFIGRCDLWLNLNVFRSVEL